MIVFGKTDPRRRVFCGWMSMSNEGGRGWLSRAAAVLATGWLFWGVAGSAWGQPAYPKARLTSLYPAGGAAGGSVVVTVGGTDLEDLEGLRFDDPGIRAFRLEGEANRFRVEIPPGARPGKRDARVTGRFGVSNPRAFEVGGARREFEEAEPNNGIGTATRLELPAAANGRIDGAGDVDHFAFEGKAGARVFLEVKAFRLDSRLDATLTLLDEAGRPLAESLDAEGSDPFLDATLPRDGTYYARVHDVVYGGSAEHVYRLTIDEGPRHDAALPAAAEPGVETELTLFGRGLGSGGEAAGGLTIEGRPAERRTVRARFEESDFGPRRFGRAGSADAHRAGAEFFPEGEGGLGAWPFFLLRAEAPVMSERLDREPGSVQEIELPKDISGLFERPDDVDVYRFRASKGSVWRVETTAEAIGSLADPEFAIRKVEGDGSTRDLAFGDDTPATPGTQDFNGRLDASVRWEVPEDGTYEVAIRDLHGSTRGDPRYRYRLVIRPERPDFGLAFAPDNATQIDTIAIPAGARTSLAVHARRIDGFNGPILVDALELPAGVTARPGVIGTGATSATIALEAAPGAESTSGPIRLRGRSMWEAAGPEVPHGRPSDLLSEPELTREAVAIGLVWPGNPPAAVSRLWGEGAGFVSGFAPASIETAERRLAAKPGESLTIKVTVERREGFGGPVTLTFPGLPPTIGPQQAVVAANATEGSFTVAIPGNLPTGLYSATIQGSLQAPFHKDPNSEQKPNTVWTTSTSPILLEVRPADFRLALRPEAVELKPGGEATVDVGFERPDDRPMTSSAELRAPEGSGVSSEGIGATGEKTGKLTLRAAADAGAGEFDAEVSATGLAGGYESKARATLKIRIAP